MATVCDENSNGKIMQSRGWLQINDNERNLLSDCNNGFKVKCFCAFL